MNRLSADFSLVCFRDSKKCEKIMKKTLPNTPKSLQKRVRKRVVFSMCFLFDLLLIFGAFCPPKSAQKSQTIALFSTPERNLKTFWRFWSPVVIFDEKLMIFVKNTCFGVHWLMVLSRLFSVFWEVEPKNAGRGNHNFCEKCGFTKSVHTTLRNKHRLVATKDRLIDR